MKTTLHITTCLNALILGFSGIAYSQPTPSSPASPPAAPAAPSSPYKDFSKYLVVVEGDKAVGSGFIANFLGQPVLFTNSHVLSGNSQIKARLLTGKPIQLGALSVADTYDISVFQQTTSNEAMDVLDAIETNAAIGDDVVVLGNSLGAGVATELKGKITGIGPELIEVDAKFVSGNSGSPVIHIKTGKVIGIATFSMLRQMEGYGKDSKFNKVERRFAYRLDNINGWKNTTWPQFVKESSILYNIQKRTDDVWALATDVAKDGKVDDWNSHLSKENCLKISVTAWQRQLGKGNSSAKAQTVSEKKRLINSVLMTLRSDLGFLNPQIFTGYNKKEYNEQISYREQLKRYFESMSDQLTNDPDFYTR